MLFLILSVICSVTVGVLFKVARKYPVNIPQIIAWNYVVAFGFCYFFFNPDIKLIENNAPWGIYISLGILLPSVFLFLAASIKHMGIVKTDVAQRLSLFISLLAAAVLFKEEFTLFKIMALLIGFLALLLILSKKTGNSKNKWIFPTVVFFGFGVIDILFKQIALYTNLEYTTSLFVVFGIALLVMISFVVYQFNFRKTVLNTKSSLFGVMVGVFNFSNILFYLKAHQEFAHNPSTVFAGMNLGVIVLGSLVGILVFKERQTKTNFLGLFLALLSIILIAISQTM